MLRCGELVLEITSDSGTEAVGLQLTRVNSRGDIILAVASKPVGSVAAWLALLDDPRIGEQVIRRVRCDGGVLGSPVVLCAEG